jgi:hypothetical protein
MKKSISNPLYIIFDLLSFQKIRCALFWRTAKATRYLITIVLEKLPSPAQKVPSK